MVRSPANGVSERDGNQLVVFPVPKYILQPEKIEFEKFHPKNSKGGFGWKSNCLLEKS